MILNLPSILTIEKQKSLNINIFLHYRFNKSLIIDWYSIFVLFLINIDIQSFWGFQSEYSFFKLGSMPNFMVEQNITYTFVTRNTKNQLQLQYCFVLDSWHLPHPVYCIHIRRFKNLVLRN